jgi:uncharacterized membrane protein YdbT with pleckstrin-like domain
MNEIDISRLKKLFPGAETETVKYFKPIAWFRYTFFITTQSLFVVLFAAMAVYYGLNGELLDLKGIFAMAGIIVSPFFPLVYWIRYQRGAYLVTDQKLYYRNGFLFENISEIQLSDIKKAEIVEEKKFRVHDYGNLSIEPTSGDGFYLLDARSPKKLLNAINRR